MTDEPCTARRTSGDEWLANALTEHRDRLEGIVKFRINPLVLGRVDANDVLQEAFLEAQKRLPRYLADPKVPAVVWLRGVVLETLIQVQRRHFAQRRTVGQEVPLHRGAKFSADSFSISIAQSLIANSASPSNILMRDEVADQVKHVLNNLNEIDREILVLRHFEQLSNDEVAAVVGVKKAATSRRYMRALKRLRDALETIPGFSFDE